MATKAINYIKPKTIRYEGVIDEDYKQNCTYGKKESELAYDNPVEKIHYLGKWLDGIIPEWRDGSRPPEKLVRFEDRFRGSSIIPDCF